MIGQSYVPVKFHNTLTNKKEVLKTQTPGVVNFYSCGPTTYDYPHVGNGRAFIVGDFIHRTLKALGYKVTFVRNFTDVDDKIIAAANEKGVSAQEHADFFVQECLKDMEELGMLPATHMPKVSDNIGEIIKMIQEILKCGDGYEVDGEVFYHVEKKHDYGKLSNRKIDELEIGKRIQVDKRKKHPADFVLWKPAKAGEPSWDSPWGKGRPGWHIECSAMAKKHLGMTIDLHHGGIDLTFPHHENEIAQSESANGCGFCDHWIHNEFLNFGSEKMSKSLGNVVTIRKFIEKYNGLILRMMMLSVHYRAKLDWTEEMIKRAIDDLERIHYFDQELDIFLKGMKAAANEFHSNHQSIIDKLGEIYHKMIYHLSNDFNSAGALAEYFIFIRLVRREIITKKLNVNSELIDIIEKIQNLFTLSLGVRQDYQVVLGKLQKLQAGDNKVDESYILSMIEQRKTAKQNKQWSQADDIRKELSAKGVTLKDNPDGSTDFSFGKVPEK